MLEQTALARVATVHVPQHITAQVEAI